MAERAMQALILTEAGRGRGNGHVSRCTGLLEAFHQSGHEAQIWVDSDLPLPDGIAVGDWKRDLDRFLPEGAPRNRVTVVDSYEADRMLLETIAARSHSCCFFDDYARLDYPTGTLVNAAFDADLLYPVLSPDSRYLTGPRYAALRKTFWTKRPYPIRPRIEHILVSLGSIATIEDTLRVAVSLRHILPKAEITVLGGSVSAQADQSLANGIHRLRGIQPELLADLALRSDLAVCAGGQVLMEMACLGVPTITMLTAENQKANIAGFVKSGFARDAGCLKHPDLLDRLSVSLKALEPAGQRARHSLRGRELVDGRGASRIVQTLAEEADL